jgi:outer membrane lipoprotein-sorting protein
MLRRFAFALGLLVSFAAIGAAQTADDIVAKTVAAQGLDKLKAVQTRRITATMTITPPGIEAPIVIENKRPMKTRATLTVQGMDNIQAYDGESAWALMPIQGKTSAEPVSGDDLKDLLQQADLDGELVNYKAKGHTVELMGKEPVQGTDTWKLKVTLKDGDVQYQYIDAEHFLPIKMEITRTLNGTPSKREIFIGDYKDEGGVMTPHSIETAIPVQGTTVTQKVTVQKVEVNVPIDDARFKMPVVK